MNTKILLINPKLDGKASYPPLGLLYLGAVLREKGYSVSIIDNDLENLSDDVLEYRIKDISPNVIGITMNTLQVPAAYATATISKRATNNKSFIVVGGPHASILPEHVLSECSAIDFVVIKEGEITLIELLKNIESNKSLCDVAGIGYKMSGNGSY